MEVDGFIHSPFHGNYFSIYNNYFIRKLSIDQEGDIGDNERNSLQLQRDLLGFSQLVVR